MRLWPASAAAASKLANDRVTPGRPSEPALKLWSGPNRDVRTAAAAPLTVLCAEVYEGKFGVTISGVQVGSDSVAGLRELSPENRMAVTGRQKLSVYLASQQAMSASAVAMFSSANRRVLSTRSRPWATDTLSAILFQCPKA